MLKLRYEMMLIGGYLQICGLYFKGQVPLALPKTGTVIVGDFKSM